MAFTEIDPQSRTFPDGERERCPLYYESADAAWLPEVFGSGPRRFAPLR